MSPSSCDIQMQDADRITRIDSDSDIPGRAAVRRRLTAPGPTPLRSQLAAEHEENTPGVDDESLALVSSSSRLFLPSLLQVMFATSSPEVTALLGWATIGIFFLKIIFLLLVCFPYICSATILYPLLILACLDVFLYTQF